MPLVKTKKSALIVTALLSMAFGAPGVQHFMPEDMQAEDSFPISTFPMFSRARPKHHRMTWVRALDSKAKPLGHVNTNVFNPSGMNQAMAHLRKARSSDRKQRRKVCEEIARRVARRKSLNEVKRIQIVDAYYIPAKVFGKDRIQKPERSRVLVSCRVGATTRRGGKPDEDGR